MTWYIDFEKDLAANDYYEWRPVPCCSLPVAETEIYYYFSMHIVRSSGSIDSAPLIFVGYFPKGSGDYKWTGYFMDHGHIGGYFDLEMNEKFSIDDESPEIELPEFVDEFRASHVDVDETRTQVYVLRGERYFSSVYFAMYLVDKGASYRNGYPPIFSHNILQYNVTLQTIFNRNSITDEALSRRRHLACTPSGPFVIINAYSYHGLRRPPVILECAILRNSENDVWDVFSLHVSDPAVEEDSRRVYHQLEKKYFYYLDNFVVTSTATNSSDVMITTDDITDFHGSFIFVDLTTRKAWFEPVVPNSKSFVTPLIPYGTYITHRALLPKK